MTYSAHMVQHVILSQLVPLPLAVAARGRRWRVPAPLAWLVGVGLMIGTALPAAYVLADGSAALEWAMRLTLIAAGLLFWTPVFGSGLATRLAPGAALLYLIAACFATTLAGAYIAFSAASTDQQIAGLIMWVPCCLVYLSASLAIVLRAMGGSGTVKAAPALRVPTRFARDDREADPSLRSG